MKDEYWGTFSIYDHRTAVYRQALLLFDRIVVPVPTRPVGNLTTKEIDQLASEVDYLTRHGAAKRVDWDPDAFAHWRQAEDNTAGHAEALARRLVNDPPHQTRLLLKASIDKQVAEACPPGVVSVTAVPVYGTREKYDEASAQLKASVEEKVALEIVMLQLPTPAPSASFDDILRVRERRTFQASLAALRNWQLETVRQLLQDPEEANIRRAAAGFAQMIEQYTEELREARYRKVTTAVTSALSVGAAFATAVGPAVGLLAAIASPLFSFRSVFRPCWKDLREMDCFPAGVVYEAKQLRNPRTGKSGKRVAGSAVIQVANRKKGGKKK